MALTLTQVTDSQDVWGGRYRVRLYDAVPAASDYATGGYSITPASIGLGATGTILGVECIAQSGGTSFYLAAWQPSTKKLIFVWSAGFTPAGTVAAPTINIAGGAGGNVNITTPNSNSSALANGTAGGALTGLTGVQAPAFTGTPAAAGGLVEVTNGTDLSATTFRLLFLGR
jgi:hypothetical protein